jgi:hypothetical protein
VESAQVLDFLGGWGMGFFCFFQFVPNVFPSCSQNVPNIITSILSDIVWPQFNFHVCNVLRGCQMKAYLGFYVEES